MVRFLLLLFIFQSRQNWCKKIRACLTESEESSTELCRWPPGLEEVRMCMELVTISQRTRDYLNPASQLSGGHDSFDTWGLAGWSPGWRSG